MAFRVWTSEDVDRGRKYLVDPGFRVTEDIKEDNGVTYTALTGGNGLRMHHIASSAHEKHNILYICDKLGALRGSDSIERDPDNPAVTWDAHDNQRRDWWGNPVVPSWYTDASLVLDLDRRPLAAGR